MSKGVSIRIPVHVRDRLREIAEENCRNIKQTIEWLVKRYDNEETLEEYIERERPYIRHAINQPGKPTTVEELFRDKI